MQLEKHNKHLDKQFQLRMWLKWLCVILILVYTTYDLETANVKKQHY